MRSVSGAQPKGAAANAAPMERLTQQDLDDEATDAAISHVIPFLEQAIERNHDRMIRTLSKDEINWIAVAAITGYIVCRSKQAKRLGCDFEDIFGLAREGVIDDGTD